MKDLVPLINNIYEPVKALVIYKSALENDLYVESHDFDRQGAPINPHPLSLAEANALASSLKTAAIKKQGFLSSSGILPENVLCLNTSVNGYAVWFTPQMKVHLHFIEELTIADGEAFVPALLWKADKRSLSIFALQKDSRPTLQTQLYHAPFFNIGGSGTVCMGNVNIRIGPECRLEDFMAHWQRYFFGSKFSHMIQDISPARMNVVQLWQSLVGTGKAFPVKSLKKSSVNIENLLS